MGRAGSWSFSEGRAWRWLVRRERDQLDDRPPGGSPVHGLLSEEAEQIVALFHEWGETDRSHRKLAHRGSYLGRCGCRHRAFGVFWPVRGCISRLHHVRDVHRSGRFLQWAGYRPNSSWIFDTTHFPKASMAVTVVEDLISRKWIAHIVSAEETSIQIEIVFTDALETEGLLAAVEARADGLVPSMSMTRPDRSCSQSRTTVRR